MNVKRHTKLLLTNERGVVTYLLQVCLGLSGIVPGLQVLADGSLAGQRGSDGPLLTPLLRWVKVTMHDTGHWTLAGLIEQGSLGLNWEREGGVSGEASKTSKQGQGGREACCG